MCVTAAYLRKTITPLPAFLLFRLPLGMSHFGFPLFFLRRVCAFPHVTSLWNQPSRRLRGKSTFLL